MSNVPDPSQNSSASTQSYSLEEALSQPYSILNEGCQAIAYESEDQRYVLKTFKTHAEAHEQFRQWGFKEGDGPSREWVENGPRSIELAFRDLREETGLIAIQLHPESTSLSGSVSLDDNSLDLSDLTFLIQKKAELIREPLKRAVLMGDALHGQMIVDDVMRYVRMCWEKGITEDTFNWDHNYGYLEDGSLIQVDVGSFWQGDEYLRREISEQKLLTSVSNTFLQELSPELHAYYVDRAEALYKDFS